eukprot:GFUD01018985.1.p1 GENE.GFUD01018985.1~~GFUD01018985.1.p1  ORF type:complete len:484 (+),score=86.69 GFUD01018985.1:52-1452(+)
MVTQTSHILEAFQTLVDGQPSISIRTGDGAEAFVSNHLLTIFSPLLRTSFAIQPPCVTPTILLPEFSSSDVQHLLNILTSGTSEFGPEMISDLQGVTELARILQIEMFSLNQVGSDTKTEYIKMEQEFDYEQGYEEYAGMLEDIKVKVKTKHETTEETKILNKQRAERAQVIRKECKEMEEIVKNTHESIRLYNKILGRTSCQYKKEKETQEHFEQRASSWEKYPGIILNDEISKFTICVDCGRVFFNMPKNHQCKGSVDYLKNKLVEIVKDWKYNEDIYDVHFKQVNVNKLECNHCKVHFLDLSSFKDHMTGQHVDMVNPKKHICAECGKGFGRTRILKQHELTQHGKVIDAVHTCTECGMLFILKSKLENHMRNKHGNERPYICDLCAKSFKQKEHLTRHYHLHSGDKDWPCRHCDKTFARSWTRTQHENLHIGHKPYKCEHCDVAFAQKNSLDCHMKSNHKYI